MPLQFKKWVPTREQIIEHRWLQPFAHKLKDKRLWRLERHAVAKGAAIGILLGFLVPVAQILAAAILAAEAMAGGCVDPDAFVISAGCLKTHNVVVATLGIKNMTLGAPLHQAPVVGDDAHPVPRLRRPGLLRREDESWLLRVEPAAFDLLLAHLPWSIAIVRMPWMPDPVYIEWPTS